MLKQLRRSLLLHHMVLVSCVLLLTMFLVLVFAVNASANTFFYNLRHELMIDFDQDIPPMQLGEKENPKVHPSTIPHIRARLEPGGQWEFWHSKSISVDQDSLDEALERIRTSEDNEKLFVDLHMGYVRRTGKDGSMLVILGDSSSVRVEFVNVLAICTALFFLSLVVLFFISLILARKSVKPVEQAWLQQRQFIADASHELKTPLTVILANNRIMSDHPEQTVQQQSQWLRSTEEEATRMHQLLTEMLNLAKADSETSHKLNSPVNISTLVEEELLYLEPIAYEKKIAINSVLAPNVTMVTDPGAIKTLLTILVDNAVKYADPGSEITVRLSSGRHTVLSVHNWGQVIPPEELPHLFDRFYRMDQSRSTAGYGLGLPIAQAITRKFSGSLSVASSEDYGTTFTAEFKKQPDTLAERSARRRKSK